MLILKCHVESLERGEWGFSGALTNEKWKENNINKRGTRYSQFRGYNL